MIGFLFGLAVGTAIGFLLGCIAAIGAKTGRDMDRMFKESDHQPGRAIDFESLELPAIHRERYSAGVRVCSCIGKIAQGYPRYVDPDCPFHGGAA